MAGTSSVVLSGPTMPPDSRLPTAGGHASLKMANETLQFVRTAARVLSRHVRSRALSIVSLIVFAILDIIDRMLCPVFAFLDSFLDFETKACCCGPSNNHIQDSQSQLPQFSEKGAIAGDDAHHLMDYWSRSSNTLKATVRRSGRPRFHFLALHRTLSAGNTQDSTQLTVSYKGIISEQIPDGRVVRNVDDETIVLPIGGSESGRDSSIRRREVNFPAAVSHSEQPVKKLKVGQKDVKQTARWSDCGCNRCTSWQSDKDQLLYVHVDDNDFMAAARKESNAVNFAAENNVIFIHGFMSSSSFWVDTVLPALPASLRTSHRLFAVDILGFGRSPKPSSSSYTISEHIDMIQRSVLASHGIQKFHLVAHSMGCLIALALAAKYPSALQSITLVAPPYFPGTSLGSSSTKFLEQTSPRKVWPLITFGVALMSWYEHIGRVICFVICKQHRLWEPILVYLYSKLPGASSPISCVTDLARHTHHSAWQIFHNTICNAGGYPSDHCLEVLQKAGKKVRVIHGTEDIMVPFTSSVSLTERHPNVRLTTVKSADHTSVIFGREAQLVEELAEMILT